MVLVGDFLQLPPVVPRDEEKVFTDMGYSTPYAFSANCLRDKTITTVKLCTVYRQDSPDYKRMLGNIRLGENLAETVNFFNDACFYPHKRAATPVILAGTKNVADGYNKRGLEKLPGREFAYEGVISGEFDLAKDKLPAPQHLALKLNSRIMMVKNDPGGRWVNGSLGTVRHLDQDSVSVKLDDQQQEYLVIKNSWDQFRYEYIKAKKSIEAKVVGSYSQIPIIPAWALTIHKAQGLTLENVRIDLKTAAFAAGQAYVALSRTRSLKGLSFATPLRVADVIVDRRLIDFLKST
jgi:hypothetical protein